MMRHLHKSLSTPGPGGSNRSQRSFFRVVIPFLILILGLSCVAQTRPTPRARPVAPAKAAPASTRKEVPPFVTKVLANGLEIVVFEDHSVPLVTVEYTNKAGSFVETPADSGYSHLMEHMFFRTNKAEKDHEEYVSHLGQLGISYNGTTREEACSEYMTATSNNLGTILHVLRDAVRYPLFETEEVEREREVVIGEFDRNRSNPYGSLNREMIRLMFSKYPNRKDPLGDPDVVRQATPEHLRALWSKYWVPNNSVVIVSGDAKPADAFALAEQYFGDWQKATDPFVASPLVEHPPLAKSTGAILESPIQDVIIEIGWQGPSIGKDTTATYAADIFDFILRQPNSRFAKALLDSGLSTNIALGYYTQRSVGPITALMVTSPEKARAAVKALQNEIAHFTDPAYFSDQDLQNAKTLLYAQQLYEREKPSEYAHTLGFWWASTGTEYYKGYPDEMANVSRADVRRYIDTYIAGKPHVSIALLSPEAQQQVHLTVSEVTGQ